MVLAELKAMNISLTLYSLTSSWEFVRTSGCRFFSSPVLFHVFNSCFSPPIFLGMLCLAMKLVHGCSPWGAIQEPEFHLGLSYSCCCWQGGTIPCMCFLMVVLGRAYAIFSFLSPSANLSVAYLLPTTLQLCICTCKEINPTPCHWIKKPGAHSLPCFHTRAHAVFNYVDKNILVSERK